MNNFVIENDVAIPAGLARAPKYPFDKMEVGQSFAVPSEGNAKLVKTRLASAARRFAGIVNKDKADGEKWGYKVAEMNDGTIRLWRVQ